MTPETHPIEKEQMMAYLDGELSSDNAERVAAHLEECAECRKLAADFQELSTRMLDWNIEASPVGLTQQVKTATEKFSNVAREKKRSSRLFVNVPWPHILWNRWLWVSAIGVVCLAIGISMSVRSKRMEGMLATYYLPPAGPPPAPENKQQELLTAPMIARTASLKITVKSLSDAHSAMDRVVSGHQGYVASLNVSSERGAPQSLDAKLAIPAAQLDAALSDLKELGHIEQEQQAAEEVTAQVVDLDARLKNARETEARLTEVLRTRTGKVGDVLEVEKEMARVREEIEQMKAEQKQLSNRVAFASIDLTLTEQYQAQLGGDPSSAGRQIRNALVDGYHDATDGLLSVCIFFLNIGPSLIVWGLILLMPARWAWRRYRRVSSLRRADSNGLS